LGNQVPEINRVATEEIAAIEKLMQVSAEPQLRGRSALSGFWSFKGLSTWEIVYRIAAIVVMTYGFWLVFLSPFFEHRKAVAFSQTTAITIVSIIGQMLMFWRFVSYLRLRRNLVDPSGSSALAVLRCQTMLMWSGFLTCLVAFKDFYDARTLPYPLRADVSEKYAQLRSCYGASTVPKTTPDFESPVLALAPKIVLETEIGAGAGAAAAPAVVAAGIVAVEAVVGIGTAYVMAPKIEGLINTVDDEVKRIADTDVGEGTLPGGADQQGESDAGAEPMAPTTPGPVPQEPQPVPRFPGPGEPGYPVRPSRPDEGGIPGVRTPSPKPDYPREPDTLKPSEPYTFPDRPHRREPSPFKEESTPPETGKPGKPDP